MAKEEILIELEELETRIDRLRALFEQYFIGIEKTEPHVQKRDVERRINALRKVQFRNTALRFRFQMIAQKYTTYLTYWQRICRQIEEGTFSRDRARQARYGAGSIAKKKPVEHVFELDADAIEEFDDFSSLSDESEPVATPPATTPAKPIAPPPPPPASVSVPTPPKIPAITQPATASIPSEVEHSVPQKPVETPKPPPAVPTPAPALVPVPVETAAPQQPAPATSTPTTTPATPAATTPAKRVGFSPFGVARNKPTTGTNPAPKVASNTKETAPSASSSVPSPAVAPKPVAPPEKPTAAVPAPSGDRTIQSLFEKYRDARQKNGEGEITYDTVARQVKDTLPKLSQQYPDHDISFDVAQKEGRTVLRPVVRPKK